jgi:acyl-CoA synthetase (AMP-forming)/AMP-acid ligase II
VIIRDLSPADLDAAWAINQANTPAVGDVSRDKLAWIVDMSSMSLVAEAQGTVVGFCIVLPPGIGGLIANVAVLLAGKIPVNLNFTASHASILSAMKQSEADRYLSADIFVRKMQAFPWPPSRQLILIERLLPTLKPQITKWFLLSKILPASLLASLLGVAKKGGDREAILLFTSGSSGDPKGVVLTHRNVIANVTQFGSRLNLRSHDAVLGCLPLFHSFGCTVTLWYPIIEGIRLDPSRSPLYLLLVALVVGLLNAVVRPILTLLSLPIVIATLGLFLLVVNAISLALALAISARFDLGLTSDGFGSTMLAAIVVSLVGWVANALLGTRR